MRHHELTLTRHHELVVVASRGSSARGRAAASSPRPRRVESEGDERKKLDEVVLGALPGLPQAAPAIRTRLEGAQHGKRLRMAGARRAWIGEEFSYPQKLSAPPRISSACRSPARRFRPARGGGQTRSRADEASGAGLGEAVAAQGRRRLPGLHDPSNLATLLSARVILSPSQSAALES